MKVKVVTLLFLFSEVKIFSIPMNSRIGKITWGPTRWRIAEILNCLSEAQRKRVFKISDANRRRVSWFFPALAFFCFVFWGDAKKWKPRLFHLLFFLLWQKSKRTIPTFETWPNNKSIFGINMWMETTRRWENCMLRSLKNSFFVPFITPKNQR